MYPERKCVWYRIYYRSKLLNRVSLLYKLKKIHNHNLEGTSSWLNVLKGRIEAPVWFVRNDAQQVKDITTDDAKRKD